MTSYGDPQSSRARARVPGSGGSAPDDDQSSRYSASARPAPDAYRRGAAGSASVGSAGRASVGSASVGSASPGSASPGRASVSPGRASVGSASPGRASVGSASVGSASVGSASVGAAPVGSARVGARAAVGAAAPGGGAAVARAAVRPTSGTGGPDDEGSIGSGKDKSKAAKRRRRTNILTAMAAVVVILLGAGVVGGTYFFDDVDLPSPVSEDQSNIIKASNGEVLARLGEQNRTVVPQPKINKVVQYAVAAAEDKNFYKHHGIDMKGIVRAAWNNFTSDDTQGASTITQQYARHAAELKEISINRKLREAVIARKLESKYNKDQIMGMYLNYIYLGKGRYGIEAAAQGYFGKSVLTPAGQKGAITPYEAAVLASIIKQPEPTATHQGYDPTVNLVDAKARWEYTMANMLEMKWITPEVYAKRKYPMDTLRKPAADKCKACAGNKPVGMVMRHVRAELAAKGISQQEFDKGGLTVTTTIVPDVQAAAEEAGSRNSKSSPMNGRPTSYQAAVIGIDPKTGRVLGYYAGDDPNGIDYGGYLSGDGKKITGGQSPGSTFKIYTLAAGLKEDISFKTTWDGTKTRPDGKKINNAGRDPGEVCRGKIKFCDLETATIKSYNFPFYWIAEGIGRDKVIEAARDAGVQHMFTDSGKMVDLKATKPETWMKPGYFDNEVAFGQYRVVPLEHAEGVATIVGNGVHHDAHFVKEVRRVDPETGKVTLVGREIGLSGKPVFPADQMSNLQAVMKEIVEVDERELKGDHEAIAKSGTWEYKKGSGDTWFVGGIPQLAATVWVGGAENKVELKEKNGKDMFGAGTPSLIWEKFLNAAVKAMDYPSEDFPERQETGNPDSDYANGQEPPPPPPAPEPENDCQVAILGCPENNDGNGQNNGGNGPNDGGNGQNGGGNGNAPGPGNGNGNEDNGDGGDDGPQDTPTFPAAPENNTGG